ncbi:MAG TPA: glycosyltransferase [Candidatus Woesebacteria bacterium]|nr:glycosyltransferase [Candidatus Woesebacteria bacterium]
MVGKAPPQKVFEKRLPIGPSLGLYKMNNQKIKIVIVINDFLVGGAQKQLVELLPYFDRSKFDFSLITLFYFEKRANLYNKLPEWLDVYQLKFKNFHDLRSWKELYGVIAEIKPDIVMSSLFFSNTIIRLIKPILRYKVITREHNTYTEKNFIQRLIDRLLAHLSDKIVAVSKGVADFTSRQEHIPITKFTVIHNGISVDNIENYRSHLPDKNTLKNSLGFREQDKILINVARLTPQKNQRLLLNAFAKFALENPEYKLLILGEGPLFGELNELIIKLKFGDQISLVGHVENPLDYYLIGEFFISTSKIEGLSNAYLESLACGLPLLSTKTAGTDELITEGENGFFINEHSVAGVLSGINKMLNKDLKTMGRFAREKVKNFDISVTANNYETLFINCYENKI